MRAGDPEAEPSLAEIAREWGRIGCIGFGGPPAHVTLFRELCVRRRGWLTEVAFERAMAATNLLPGPASTQLAIYCAWRLRGRRGALLGGLCFVIPGLVMILALSALFLSGSPPAWLRGAGLGAGAAVPAVALRAGLGVGAPLWRRSGRAARSRVVAYGLAGGSAAAFAGAWLVLVLLARGAAELARESRARSRARLFAGPLSPWPLGRGAPAREPSMAHRLLARGILLPAGVAGGTGALAWTAFKVGALAFGGGFVIVPLMQSDAVTTYHWMTDGQFLNAVALGQVTPGPSRRRSPRSATPPTGSPAVCWPRSWHSPPPSPS